MLQVGALATQHVGAAILRHRVFGSGVRYVARPTISEALFSYRAGEKAWPDKEFERQYIKPQQDARYEHDIWTERVERYLTDLLTPRTTVREIAKSGLEIEDRMMDSRTEKRIVSVLQSLGWTRGKTGSVRYWYKPEH